MSNWTPVLFYRRPDPHETQITTRKVDNDVISICSVMDITLPRFIRNGKRRQENVKRDKIEQVGHPQTNRFFKLQKNGYSNRVSLDLEKALEVAKSAEFLLELDERLKSIFRSPFESNYSRISRFLPKYPENRILLIMQSTGETFSKRLSFVKGV